MAGEPPNTPEDISQDDIDAALSAANGAFEETPPSDTVSDSVPAPDAEGGSGEASQTAAEAESEASGEMSQVDIDAALAAAADASQTEDLESADPTPVEAGDAASAGSDPAGGESSDTAFSREDIDAARAMARETATDEAPAAESSASHLDTMNADGLPKLDSRGRPFDEAAARMEAAIAEERAAAEAVGASQSASGETVSSPALSPPPAGSVPLELPDFSGDATAGADTRGIALLNDVNLDVKIELGRANMFIEDVLKLGEGSVVELDKLAGDPVDILVNDRLVARGEVLVLNDNFCVRISEILIGPDAGLVPA